MNHVQENIPLDRIYALVRFLLNNSRRRQEHFVVPHRVFHFYMWVVIFLLYVLSCFVSYKFLQEMDFPLETHEHNK